MRMKRDLVLVAFLCLLVISNVNPLAYVDSRTIAGEASVHQESPFLTAADGDVSSESIGEDYSHKFRETLDDDVLFYPDEFFRTDIRTVASDGSSGPSTTGTYVNTQSNPETVFKGYSGAGVYVAWVILNFTVPEGLEVDRFRVTTRYQATVDIVDASNFSIYDWVADEWVFIKICRSIPYTNQSTDACNPNYWADGVVKIRHTGYDDYGYVALHIAQADILWYEMHLADSEHHAESFADISDITVSVGETVTTDDDLGTFHHPGDNAWDYYFWNDPSALAVQVIEWRCHANISSSSYEFALYSADDGGGSQLWTSGSITAPTSAATEKYSPMVTGIESIRLATRHASSPASFIFDYLRGGPSTETGWAHDGSTTAAVSDEGSAGWTTTLGSDGDILTIQTNKTSGIDQYYWNKIRFDDTATKANAEYDYYPFFAMRWRVTESVNSRFLLYINLDDTIVNFWGTTENETTGWTTSRWNAKAASPDSADYDVSIYTQVPTAGDTASIVFEMDWCKLFSIANNTLTQSGVNSDDYLYVDSGVLHSHVDSGYIELDHDPALSVSDTYSVYNLTTSGTAPEFSQYVSSWSSYSDETRGATTSGTVTDIRLKFDSTETISAIKFIEDGTAPTVVRSSSTPNDPSDDEDVMLTAVITDAIEVYKVYFDAIVSPDGFSDVPYYATEQTDNLWTYEFSTLTTGPYVFKIVATDGANENILTEYAYIELTVRESEIIVEEITLLGAGQDFTMMTFSARINKDCSYVIYEESENNAESATHSGSVSEPSFNLAWTKLSTTDTNVNFTIRFTNGTLTYNYTSQYQVAQTALSVTGDESLSQDEIVYSGTSTKACSWTLYLDSVQEDTGTISAAGSFVVNWTRTQSITPASISFAIKFYTATETVWENGTYSEYSLTAFSIQTLFMSLTDPTVSAIFTTSWGNATGYLYEDDVQQDTAAEGITLSYSKATAAGTYNVALKMDAGGEIAWYNTTYSISAENALSITALSFDSSGPNVSLFVNTNWANCTLTVYENEVQKASGSEGTLSYLKATIAGDYNVSVKVDGTADILWANYTYTVAAESALIINALILDKSGPNVTAFVTTNWANCTITIYQDDVQKDSDSESITLSYARSTAAGTYAIAIKIDGGASTLWHNDSYTIAIEYSWQYIYVFDTGDPATYFPWESFDFYVNGSLIEKNEFHGRTDQGYRIAVVDKFGDTIYNATHSFDYTYRLSIAIYSFKVKCWVDGEVNVTITSSAGGVMNTWMGWGDLEEFYLFGSKTYQVKWFLDNSDRKVKATGWHYYPALDWDGNQANPDPNWYGPVSASYLTLDDYGIGHLVGVVEDIDDGGGGDDANSTEIAEAIFQSLAPLSVGVGAGFAGIFLGIYFVYVAIKNIQASMGATVIVEQPAAEKNQKTKSRTGDSRLKSGVRGREQRGRFQ